MADAISEPMLEIWQPVTWQEFCQLTRRKDYEKGRFYFDHGYMKLEMSPLGFNHSRDNAVVARLISLFATLNNISILELTNVTLRKAQKQQAQPDSSFYISDRATFPPRSNEPIDLDQYSAPTLVIEIASTTLSDDLGKKRLLYERLGVGEYWVIDTNTTQITALEMIDGGSREIRVSQVLPALSIAIAEETLEKSRNQDDGEVNRWLMEMFTQP